MRLLVDEYCDRVLVETPKAAGHDVIYIAESHSGLSDPAVAELGSLERRVLVTYDFDFGELAVRHGVSAQGVVLVACHSLLPTDRAMRVAHVLSAVPEGLDDRVTIVEPTRIRQRKLDR